MQLTLHATRPTPHGASRLVQASKCLPGRQPDLSHPGITGMRGSTIVRLRPSMTPSTLPPPHPYTPRATAYARTTSQPPPHPHLRFKSCRHLLPLVENGLYLAQAPLALRSVGLHPRVGLCDPSQLHPELVRLGLVHAALRLLLSVDPVGSFVSNDSLRRRTKRTPPYLDSTRIDNTYNTLRKEQSGKLAS